MASNASNRGTNTPRHHRARRGAASRSEEGKNAPQKKNLDDPPSSTKDPLPNSGRMNLMASVSRSSGLGKDGDDLKNWGTQQEYRKFIQDKLDHVLKNHGKRPSETQTEKKSRLENQDNVLILFRKLREGVASSDRSDRFALEVYETSLSVSIIFDSPKQTTSIVPHLFPPESDPKNVLMLQPSVYSVLCSLLHHLVAYYPSQSQYHRHLRSINEAILPRDSDAFLWFSSLTKTLRMRNYARLAVLGSYSMASTVISQGLKSTNSQIVYSNLAHDAVLCLLDALRQRAAETAWSIIRSAYRELSTDKTADVTRAWLVRSLSLESVYDSDRSMEAVEWLESKVALGSVRKKEGQDRWVVCKAR